MRRESVPGLFEGYAVAPGTFDELFDSAGNPRAAFLRTLGMLGARTCEDFARFQSLAERALLNQGVTFSVYSDPRGTEKIFPFCLIPRVISAADWTHLERGLEQRVRALGLFLDDVYGEQRMLAEQPVPARDRPRRQAVPARSCAASSRRAACASTSPASISSAIPHGTFRVLEDNLRTPSGVSYVVENRIVSKRVMPEVFEQARVRRVDHYPARLAETLRAVSPERPRATPPWSCSRPGPYNSAYFEHTFLARTMGVELVQRGRPLRRRGPRLRAHHARPAPRRTSSTAASTTRSSIPRCSGPDSLLGVRGLMRAYAAGNVALANAPGNGVADDKAVYAFVPRHDPLLPRRGAAPRAGAAPTCACARRIARTCSSTSSELVVKAVDEAGGYGMLMGPQSTRGRARRVPPAHPRRAAPLHRPAPRRAVDLPDVDRRQQPVAPRRVDLRPYILTGPQGPWVLPGGLTPRGAASRARYVVNSSQGGGSKDTWVQKEPHDLRASPMHCFWFGRYLERAESTARVLAGDRARWRSTRELPPEQCWQPGGGRLRRGASASVARARRRPPRATASGCSSYMTWDEKNPSSLCAVAALRRRENARSIREVVASRRWEAVNELYLWMPSDEARRECHASTATASTGTCAARRSCAWACSAHDAPRRAARLHLARRAARARGADGAHARRAPPRLHAAAATATQVVETRAVAVAAARLLGLRGLHEAPPGPGDGRRGGRASCSSSRSSRARSATA